MEIAIGSPYVAQFNLTNRCILDCAYCYLKSANIKTNSFLEYQQFQDMINKLVQASSSYNFDIQINLTGGDLWLYPEIERVLILLKNNPKVTGVGLILNNLWYPNAKKYIKIIKPKVTIVQINIDTIANRPKDIAYLIKNNIRTAVKILISNDQEYFQKQCQIAKTLLKKHPKVLISFDRLTPSDSTQIKNLSSESLYKQQLYEIKQIAGKNLITDDPYSSCHLKITESSSDSVYGCAIPFSGITIFPDGSIKICARIPQFDTKFNIHNFEFEKYLKKFSHLNEQKSKKCLECVFKEICSGGCPATSYVISNKISKDNHCSQKSHSKYLPFHRYKISGNPLASTILTMLGCYECLPSEAELAIISKSTNIKEIKSNLSSSLSSNKLSLKTNYSSSRLVIPCIIPVFFNDNESYLAIIGQNLFGMYLVFDHRLRHPVWFSPKLINMIINKNKAIITIQKNGK